MTSTTEATLEVDICKLLDVAEPVSLAAYGERPMFHPGLGHTSGMFSNRDDLVRYCAKTNLPVPEKVFGTKPKIDLMDVHEILGYHLGLEYSEIAPNIPESEIEALQNALDEWVMDQKNIFIIPDYEVAVVLGLCLN